MCGIAGAASRSGVLDLGWIQMMTDRLRHRGPDDEGYLVANWLDGHAAEYGGNDSKVELPPIRTSPSSAQVALGHRRLAVLDLSAAGHQPMSGPRRNQWIVFNGEIYNHPELRRELEGLGRSFRSHTDTEVLLAAYETWGEGCLERIDGMWAFVVYDHDRGGAVRSSRSIRCQAALFFGPRGVFRICIRDQGSS